MSVFSFQNFAKNQGYRNIRAMYWKDPTIKLPDDGLRILEFDSNVLYMIKVMKKYGGDIHIYYEHTVDDPQVIETEVLLLGD